MKYNKIKGKRKYTIIKFYKKKKTKKTKKHSTFFLLVNMSTGNKMPSVQLSRIFSYVTFRNMRFLILDCPSNENLPIYLEVCLLILKS